MNKTPKMSLRIEKRGFHPKYHDQNMKNFQLPAQLLVNVPDRAVRFLLPAFPAKRPWHKVYAQASTTIDLCPNVYSGGRSSGRPREG